MNSKKVGGFFNNYIHLIPNAYTFSSIPEGLRCISKIVVFFMQMERLFHISVLCFIIKSS